MINYFYYNKKNILTCEDTEITKIVESENTPVYIYSSKCLIDNFLAYKKAFQVFDPIICYALKANSNMSLVNLLRENGAGADIVSGGELFRALDAGILPKKIVYAGVGKTDSEIESALLADILMFNAESFEEIIHINTVAGKLHKKACIAIRINPDVDSKTHPYISTGLKKNKFGINIKNVKDLIKKIIVLPNISLVGIHIHIGSQLIDISPLYESIQKIIPLIRELSKEGTVIKYLNLGGGLGIRYNDEIPPTPEKYINLIKSLLVDINCRLILEPGRSIVGNAGILVTKVLYNKTTDNKKFIIVNAGMNDLIRPTLYDAYHEIIPVEKKASKIKEKVDIVGPICESGDFLARDRLLPKVDEGEFLAVNSTGAYGFSMSSNYNSRPRASEVLVNGKNFHVIRSRETYIELIQKEQYKNILFSKMNASGNDFILMDNREGKIKKNLSEFAKGLCTQKHSIGADGIIFIEKSKYADFMMRIFNMDGSEAEMCGNGARCTAKFAFDKKIVPIKNMSFETKSGIIFASVNANDNQVRIKMQDPLSLKIHYKVNGYRSEINSINTGVPHVVIFVDKIDNVDVQKTGNFIRYHKYFSPQGTNVNFAEMVSKNKIKIRTYERGVENETFSCGTGSVASALIYAINYNAKSPIEVITRCNDVLTISYKSSHNNFNEVYLEGLVKLVYDGYYYLT